MTLCNLVLTPIVGILHALVAVLRQIVETVCGWAMRTIRVLREVTERVCRRLPWPLSVLCGWVRRLIGVLETVSEWVCETALGTSVEFVELVVEYVIVVLGWVCWLVDWIAFRWLAYLLCRAGIDPPRRIPLCPTILTDARGPPMITAAQAEQMGRESNEPLRQCDLALVVGSIRFVAKPDLIENVPTGAGQLFGRAFAWFDRDVCDCCSGVTVHLMRSLDSGARGHAIPGAS